MIHTEAAFETVCAATLLLGGYVSVDKAGFDSEQAIFPADVIRFIKGTQAKDWARIEAVLGDKTEAQVLRDLVAWIDSNRYSDE